MPSIELYLCKFVLSSGSLQVMKDPYSKTILAIFAKSAWMGLNLHLLQGILIGALNGCHQLWRKNRKNKVNQVNRIGFSVQLNQALVPLKNGRNTSWIIKFGHCLQETEYIKRRGNKIASKSLRCCDEQSGAERLLDSHLQEYCIRGLSQHSVIPPRRVR